MAGPARRGSTARCFRRALERRYDGGSDDYAGECRLHLVDPVTGLSKRNSGALVLGLVGRDAPYR